MNALIFSPQSEERGPSDNIQLRRLQVGDAMALHTMIATDRDYFLDWMPAFGGLLTTQNCRRFIAYPAVVKSLPAHYGVWLHGALVGYIGIATDVDTHQIGSLTYALAARFQGRGLMTQACRAIIHNSFNKGVLQEFDISCAVDNNKSRAIAERLHSVHVTTERTAHWLYYRYVDVAIYRLSAGQWQPEYGFNATGATVQC